MEENRAAISNIKDNIKDIVNNQFREAGFDPELSAGMLATPSSHFKPARMSSSVIPTTIPSYAAAAACPGVPTKKVLLEVSRSGTSQSDRREDRFWECGRSLRLWPVKGMEREDLQEFLIEKLRMDRSFVDNELGPVTIRKNQDKG